MGLLQALRKHKPIENKKKRAGQSLIEMALALPIMLIMISGLIEFGFALNQYLNTLDAAREAARFATDSDPLDRDFASPGVTDTNCAETLDFYMQAACIAVQTMSPVDFNTTTDDVVISVFRVLSGTVIGRWPNCEPVPSNDCPFDPSPFPQTMGEWHLYGRGNGCVNAVDDVSGNSIDDDGDGDTDDGCLGGPIVNGASEYCDSGTDLSCHPSRLTNQIVTDKLEADAPDSAVLLVEVFYNYPQVLKLPWIVPFVSDPMPLHTYTILPLPAAEPSLTITGTVTYQSTGLAVYGATIGLNNGMVAVTDASGQYARTGLSSGTYVLTPELSGCTFTPVSQTVTLVFADVYDIDFEVVCVTPPPPGSTATFTPTQTETPTPTPTETPTPTPTPTDTATPGPTCNAASVDPSWSSVDIVSPVPALVIADGTTPIQVVVTARNDCGDLLPNRLTTLDSNRGTDTVTPASLMTDANGQAIFSVTSTDMSTWDGGAHDFQASTFSGISDGVAIADTAQGAFSCVAGQEGTPSGLDDVAWVFTNDTGSPRRLVEIQIRFGVLPQLPDPSLKLINIDLGPNSIWSLETFANPATINSDWTGVSADRVIGNASSEPLSLIFNFTTTGGQTYELVAVWDNTSGTNNCSSDLVTVVRP